MIQDVPLLLTGLQAWLWRLLMVGYAGLGLLAIVLIVVRLGIKLRAWRRQRLEAFYRPIVDALADAATSEAARVRLLAAPRRHLGVIGRLMLALLSLTSGQMVENLRAGASSIGLVARWRAGLTSRRWWERAESVHALGLVRQPDCTDDVLTLLDDPHEEVRAAAVTALGWLADPAAIPALLVRLTDETRHQKVRIVEALQRAGPAAGPAILAHFADHPHPAPAIVDLVAHLRLTAALDHLVRWTLDADAGRRAAALRALGILGPDDRTFYHALKALTDPVPQVRAMAARTVGLTGRTDAVAYLVPHLKEDWLVAVEAALALRKLGAEGLAALTSSAAGDDDAAALAQHVLWNDGRGAAPESA